MSRKPRLLYSVVRPRQQTTGGQPVGLSRIRTRSRDIAGTPDVQEGVPY